MYQLQTQAKGGRRVAQGSESAALWSARRGHLPGAGQLHIRSGFLGQRNRHTTGAMVLEQRLAACQSPPRALETPDGVATESQGWASYSARITAVIPGREASVPVASPPASGAEGTRMAVEMEQPFGGLSGFLGEPEPARQGLTGVEWLWSRG